MWRVDGSGQSTLFVAIGAQRVECGVWSSSGWVPESLFEVRLAAGAADKGLGGLGAALAEAALAQARWQATLAATSRQRVRAVRAVVADGWLSAASVPWSASLQRADTAALFARGQLAQAGLDAAALDTLRLDDAPFAQPRWVVNYPAALLEALHKLANGAGAPLSSVLPLSAVAWASVRRPGLNALAVVDEGLLMVAQGDGRLGKVTVRAGDRTGLHGLWQRMGLREPQLAHLQSLAVLDLATVPELANKNNEGFEPNFLAVDLPRVPPAAGVSRRLHLAALAESQVLAIDAIPAKRAMTPLRWAGGLAALLLAGGLTLQAWQAAAHLRALQTQWGIAQNHEASTVRPASWSREQQARVPAVNAAIRELNLPVSALLRAMEPPRDIRVAVLAVDVLGGALKLTGEARSGVEMARYVAFVAARKPFTGAYLTHHEIDESSPERPYRFTVEATWAD